MTVVDINWKPTDRELRTFSLLQWGFFSLIAMSVILRHRAPAWGLAIIAVSTALAITGFAKPRLIRPVYIAWMVAVFPIGWAVSHVILAAVYFLVLTPIGLVLRATGHDPMERRWDPNATTYWKPRGEPPEPGRYFRQF